MIVSVSSGMVNWYLDTDGIIGWQGPGSDTKVINFGLAGDIPVVGDWDGDVNGTTNIGVFRNGTWYLDTDGTIGWQGSGSDTKLIKFGCSW